MIIFHVVFQSSILLFRFFEAFLLAALGAGLGLAPAILFKSALATFECRHFRSPFNSQYASS
jgi:hypothetical protein